MSVTTLANSSDYIVNKKTMEELKIVRENNRLYLTDGKTLYPYPVGGGGSRTIIKNVPSNEIKAYAYLSNLTLNEYNSGDKIQFQTIQNNKNISQLNLTDIKLEVAGKYKLDFIVRCRSLDGPLEKVIIQPTLNNIDVCPESRFMLITNSANQFLFLSGTVIFNVNKDDIFNLVAFTNIFVDGTINDNSVALSIVKIDE